MPRFIPHDDAYAILSMTPTHTSIPALRVHLQEAASERSTGILEPIVALIVDHSRISDSYWPTLLSVLISAGVIDYFERIAALPLPDLAHATFRKVQEAKRDALTGMMRCFEQVSAEDRKLIPERLLGVLRSLATDETQPMLTQRLAHVALLKWGDQCAYAQEAEASAVASVVKNGVDAKRAEPLNSEFGVVTCLIVSDDLWTSAELEANLISVSCHCSSAFDGAGAITELSGAISKIPVSLLPESV